jgi:hypothetical protein
MLHVPKRLCACCGRGPAIISVTDVPPLLIDVSAATVVAVARTSVRQVVGNVAVMFGLWLQL